MQDTSSDFFNLLIQLSILIPLVSLSLIGQWKLYEKARYPGWACLIPFYGQYVLLKIVNRPGWWLIFYFIPFGSIILGLIVAMDLAEAFGRSGLFGFFLNFLFQPIGFIILGFGKSQYQRGNNTPPLTPPVAPVPTVAAPLQPPSTPNQPA